MENYNNIMNPEYNNIVYGHNILQTNALIEQNSVLVQHNENNIQNQALHENNMEPENTPLENNENLDLESENLKNTNENTIIASENEINDVCADSVNDYNADIAEVNDTNVIEPMETESAAEEKLPEDEVAEDISAEPFVPTEPAELPEDKSEDADEPKVEEEPENKIEEPAVVEEIEDVELNLDPKPAEPVVADICRVCLKAGELINIFDTDGNLKLFDKVMLCASVQVVKKDGLPDKICSFCVEKLNTAYDFKITCETSDAELRKKYNIVVPKTVVKTEFVLIECDDQDYDLDEDSEKEVLPLRKRYKDDSEDFVLSETAEDSGSDSSFALNKSAKGKKRQKRKKAPKRALPKRLKRDTARIASRSNRKREEKKRVEKIKEEYLDEQPLFARKTSSKKAKYEIEDDNKPLITIKKIKKADVATKHSCTILEQDMRKHNTDFHAEDLDDDVPQITRKQQADTSTKERRCHKCPFCDKEYTNAILLKTHKKTHVGEKPFVCHICQKGFKQTVSLEAHIKRHNEDKSLKCDICEKYCLTKVELKRHITAEHAEQKPFECEVCQKAFASKMKLEKHVAKHEKEDEVSLKDDGKKKTPSTKDLFKSIAPITSTYWSDSYSD